MLSPVSRDALLRGNAKVVEETHNANIKMIVGAIYNSTINISQTTTETIFYYPISGNEFCIKNMGEILSHLKVLFPGCSVIHTLIAIGKDGKYYDISKINDEVLPILEKALDSSFIVIDWS